MFKILGSVLTSMFLSNAREEVAELARKQMSERFGEGIRKHVISRIAEQYTREVEHNVSKYIQALGESSVDIEFVGKPGEAFIRRAESAVEELENYIDAQKESGPVIDFIKRRYGEEGIRIITGRLYAGHYINKKSQGTYEIMNRMGYASAVDKRKPWLSSPETAKGIAEIISESGAELFTMLFEDVDLSSEIGGMTFSGAGSKLLSGQSTTGMGFGKYITKQKPKKKKK
jgi:hypothetical protein